MMIMILYIRANTHTYILEIFFTLAYRAHSQNVGVIYKCEGGFPLLRRGKLKESLFVHLFLAHFSLLSLSPYFNNTQFYIYSFMNPLSHSPSFSNICLINPEHHVFLIF